VTHHVSNAAASSRIADRAHGDDLDFIAEPPPLVHDGSGARDDRPSDPLLRAELEFYEDYKWSLNPHLSVRETVDHLHEEIARLERVPQGWQADEVAANIFLLAGGLLNSIDEDLREPSLRLPSRIASMRLGRAARWAAETSRGILKPRPRAKLRAWRDGWLEALSDFLRLVAARDTSRPAALAASVEKLSARLREPLPAALQKGRVGVPSPFRRLDFTHLDILALGRRYVAQFPDRAQPILLLGLRTSGSYFAPLLHAYLTGEGFTSVAVLTMVPGKGTSRWEQRELERYARQGYTAVILDDSPHTGGTIFTAFDIARRTGFAIEKLKALIPAHPARPDWYKPLPDDMIVSLAPADWHKRSLLTPAAAQARLADYFGAQGFDDVRVIDSSRLAALNAQLDEASPDVRGARLKRIFEVQLARGHGGRETRFVLAKSVGWGWLGYHAFLVGHRLSGHVPPVLGLRDGILYTEWIAQDELSAAARERGAPQPEEIAAYVAARVRHLGLRVGSAGGANLQRQDNGIRVLGKMLSRAHGSLGVNMLMQSRIERRLRRRACPVPTLIDGKMQQPEWIVGPHGPLKTDFEHHGLGKEELNVADPAYDLAAAILDRGMSGDEERRLVQRYIEESGDTEVAQRLFMQKLLAGLWAMKQAREHLFAKPQTIDRHRVQHDRFMAAWHFLTVEAARYCGSRFAPSDKPQWRAPLISLDIDGVIDRRVFGFPHTTEAGIAALSLLRRHGFSIAVNSARSEAEMKAYCEAYGLAGGIAEHGGYIWDAVRGRGRGLLGDETLRQLDELRKALRQVPGVFLDERHNYSIRAFTYLDKPHGLFATVIKTLRSSDIGDGVLAPLPTLLISHLMTDLGLDRLSFHHTSIDTTVVAKETDKGSGLVALRDWVLGPQAETVAAGDQEPDLAQFRVATRSFAPANIGCAREARLLGCRIVRGANQPGLLEIARAIVAAYRPDARDHDNAAIPKDARDDAFIDALHAADRGMVSHLVELVFGRRG
jgi:hydroxymethylpyrimidine pyrophosphatase-like HAD family hydrolase